ncbi:MAG: class I tRNA ligase family protein [Planctomycetota bacterium]
MSYYVTTPIYYVNDRPHIGHCYTTLLADVAARAHRLFEGGSRGTFFLTGTDEHAEKVVTAAAERGLSPLEWADRNAAEFQKAFASMGFTNDDFVRTSEARHKDRASAMIRRLVDSGDIVLGDYEGWWDPSQEEYLTETVARESGFKSPVTGRPLEKRVEQNYFFRLEKHADWLLERIEGDHVRVLPEARKNEVLGRIRQGLRDVPVSRKIEPGSPDWGITMPGDDEHRVYVWIEALCNYVTAIEQGDRRRFWPAQVHVMAKDILWFHAVIWPAMLRALGEEPPQTVYAHAYWIREGRKMSKSLGNFIEIETLDAYADRYSLDAVRWYLLTQGPMGATDADFVHDRFVEVYNAELANGFGNSVSRVSKMVQKYFDGELPRECNGEFGFLDGKSLQLALRALTDAGKPPEDPSRTFHLAHACRDAAAAYREAFDRFALDEMVHHGLGLVRIVDEFISYAAPFTLAKRLGDLDHAEKALATILYSCAETLRVASLLLSPVLPEKAAAVWRAWGCEPPEGVPLGELAIFNGDHGIRSGAVLESPEALFMRADPSDAVPSGVVPE